MSGRVTDQQGALLGGAEVQITNIDTNLVSSQSTNREGLYVISGLRPGRYRVSVTHPGFRTVNLTGVVLNVQDAVSQTFKLQLGSVSESITVVADSAKVSAESVAVSTLVDRGFVENLPLNGRSFQTLIQLTPGVTLTPANGLSPGQFSVNGQRSSANNFMVDGVSANIGVAAGFGGQAFAGTSAGFSVLGGSNNLASVDELQEFRIQTSTYAPEFGRSPGAQIFVETRSGTNSFHGTAYDYVRNDIFDASDWFNGYKNSPPLPKAKERQNDFGGVFGGPILKSRTFFFSSYEGLRLRQPQTQLTTVPSLNARSSAPVGIQPYLNAYPLPNRPTILDPNGNPTDIAPFNASYSNPSTLNTAALRIDHSLSGRARLFGRYSYSTSETRPRGIPAVSGPPLGALSVISAQSLTSQTITLGFGWTPRPTVNNDLRFNYSHNEGTNSLLLDSFGGAVPPADSAIFPAPFTRNNAFVAFFAFDLQPAAIAIGPDGRSVQRQINVIDGLAWQKGAHTFKFGFDYRHLSPVFNPVRYDLAGFFNDTASAVANAPAFVQTNSATNGTLFFNNVGAYAQDTWRLRARLTATYGLRWELDPAPHAAGVSLVAAANSIEPSNLQLARPGSPLYKTTYANIAPRIGLAYQLSESEGRETVLRGGAGVYYDLASTQVGDVADPSDYPFGVAASFFNNVPGYPLPSSITQPPTISLSTTSQLHLTAPRLKLPYTLQWNVAVDRSLGTAQSLSVSYLGTVGRRLLEQAVIFPHAPSLPELFNAIVTENGTRSNYQAFQAQLRRSLQHGLQLLASYTWSHSIDEGSNSISQAATNVVFGGEPKENRGPSDFDVRHAATGALTYNLPTPRRGSIAGVMLGGWSTDSIFQARTALPVTVIYSSAVFQQSRVLERPDVLPGIPLYLYSSQYPGGKAINPAAFAVVPNDPNTHAPDRQGNLERNGLRGFGAWQWDFVLRRQLTLREGVNLQFRAELFNLLNHPNLGSPNGNLTLVRSGFFGLASQTLSQSLGSNGGLIPLYEFGGPRSIQLAMKLQF